MSPVFPDLYTLHKWATANGYVWGEDYETRKRWPVGWFVRGPDEDRGATVGTLGAELEVYERHRDAKT